jgi:diketogulonate reductase-like aldo/keto reductase
MIPALGLGTWHLAENPRQRPHEIAALRLGIAVGMTLIDTAEMYGDGASEELIGEAIEGMRDQVFIVDKVLPSNGSLRGTVLACERSLQRLGTDRIDLYLLHWRGPIPLAETVDAFGRLIAAGKIRMWGVSNFDVDDMEELFSFPEGRACQTDQVLYNLTQRGIEWDLLPWCRERRIPIMAYAPIEQGRLLEDAAIVRIARRHDATPAEIAIAWVLRDRDVNAIPKAGTPKHVRENRRALDIRFTQRELEELDGTFPPPTEKRQLEML